MLPHLANVSRTTDGWFALSTRITDAPKSSEEKLKKVATEVAG